MSVLFLNRKAVIVITIVLALCATAWFGNWWMRANALLGVLPDRRVELAELGWRWRHGAPEILGAPNRLDLSLPDAEISDMAGDWGWRTDNLDMRGVVYRNDYVALFTNDQRLCAPIIGDIEIQQAAASLIFETRSLSRLSIELEQVVGAGLIFKKAQLDLRPHESGDPTQYEAFFRGLADNASSPTPSIALHGALALTKPILRGPISFGDIAELSIGEGSRLEWANARLRLRGSVSARVDGWRGSIGFHTDQAERVINRLEKLGALGAQAARTLHARISGSGRIAGVLVLEADRLVIRDIGPDDVPLRP